VRENSRTRSPISISSTRESTESNSPEQIESAEVSEYENEIEQRNKATELEHERLQLIRKERQRSQRNSDLDDIQEETLETPEEEILNLSDPKISESEISSNEQQEENNNETNMDNMITRPMKFTGNGTMDPDEWLKNFCKAATVNGWNDNTSKTKMAGFLYEDAEEWYLEFMTADDNNNLPTWTATKAAFLNRFKSQKWKNKWRNQMENLKQRLGESIDSYHGRFKRLVNKGLEVAEP